jgi:hypothetical protein
MSISGWSGGTRLAYLASPYRHHLRGRVGAYMEASKLAAKLLQTGGIHIFSPVTHTHPMVMHGELDLVEPICFGPLNARFLQLCEVLIVARLAGWEHSEGVAEAVRQFEHGPPWRPIFDCYWDSENRVVMARREVARG